MVGPGPRSAPNLASFAEARNTGIPGKGTTKNNRSASKALFRPHLVLTCSPAPIFHFSRAHHLSTARSHVPHQLEGKLARLGGAGDPDDGLVEADRKEFVQAVAALAAEPVGLD
jgi:hypothetical protein